MCSLMLYMFHLRSILLTPNFVQAQCVALLDAINQVFLVLIAEPICLRAWMSVFLSIVCNEIVNILERCSKIFLNRTLKELYDCERKTCYFKGPMGKSGCIETLIGHLLTSNTWNLRWAKISLESEEGDNLLLFVDILSEMSDN